MLEWAVWQRIGNGRKSLEFKQDEFFSRHRSCPFRAIRLFSIGLMAWSVFERFGKEKFDVGC